MLAAIIALPSLAFAQVIYPNRGGTGTTTVPTVGQVLVAYPNGTYGPMATSSLGITAVVALSLTGEDYLTLSGTSFTALGINPDNLAAADFGSFSCNGTTCVLDADTVGQNEIDLSTVTLADFTNDAGFITSADDTVSGSELDGVFSTAGLLLRTGAATYSTITNNSTNWNTAYGWGNHAAAGYLTSYTETDPVFAASAAAGISAGNISNWDTAYGWGNHASAGYISSTAGNWTGTFDGIEGTAYLARSNHTGTQLASTISDFTSAVTALTVGTTTSGSAGSLAFWTGTRTLGTIATGTLTESVTGLQISAARGLIGGSADISLTSGYEVPLTASTTQWKGFYDTPSSRITAGTGLSWSGNTLNGIAPTVYLATSSPWTVGQVAHVTGNGTIGSTATGTLTETVTGLEFDSLTRGLLGGSAVLSLTSGYAIPLSASSTQWTTAFNWGNHASAGYLTGNQTITLSGDASGSGATAITVAVADDSHAHTGSTISGLDISDDTNLAAGRSLTLTGDSVEADAELYTDTSCIYLEDPTADDDLKSIWKNHTANDLTFTKLWGESDQTVAFDLQVDDGTPADVNGTDITPAAGTAEDTTLSGDTTLAVGETLDLDVTSTSGTPTWVSICWTYQWND